MEIKPCPRCNKKDYIDYDGKCGNCKKSRRICDHCKKAMGNSWHTETGVGELEIYVHSKCAEEWNICNRMGDMADFVNKTGRYAKGGKSAQ